MRPSLIVTLLFVLSAPALAQTQQKPPPKAPAPAAPAQPAPAANAPDAPQVHALYAMGYVARTKCEPGVHIPLKFESNFQIVFFKAAQALQESRPGASLEAAAKYLLTQSFANANAFAREIDEKGCDTPKVKQLLQIQRQTEAAPDLLNPPQ